MEPRIQYTKTEDGVNIAYYAIGQGPAVLYLIMPRRASSSSTWEKEGHSVVVAEDGLVAVEEARRRAPDLLILDVMMPNSDGHDVCRIIRAETQIPILILTDANNRTNAATNGDGG